VLVIFAQLRNYRREREAGGRFHVFVIAKVWKRPADREKREFCNALFGFDITLPYRILSVPKSALGPSRHKDFSPIRSHLVAADRITEKKSMLEKVLVVQGGRLIDGTGRPPIENSDN